MTRRNFWTRCSKKFVVATLLAVTCFQLGLIPAPAHADTVVDSSSLLMSKSGDSLADEILILLRGSGSFKAGMQRFCALHAVSVADLDACLKGLDQSLALSNNLASVISKEEVANLIAPSLELLARGSTAQAAQSIATDLSKLLCKALCYQKFFAAVQQAIDITNGHIARCCAEAGGTIVPHAVPQGPGIVLDGCGFRTLPAPSSFDECMIENFEDLSTVPPSWTNPAEEFKRSMAKAHNELKSCLARCNRTAAPAN